MPGSLSGEKKGKRAALDREKLAFAFFIALIIVFNVLLALRHESWRDEAQAWLMAKNLSFTELFKELSYEGHPCLWFLVLMPFAKLGLPYMTVKLVSTVLIAAVLILIACFAPVSRAAKMLIAASPAVPIELPTKMLSTTPAIAIQKPLITAGMKKRRKAPRTKYWLRSVFSCFTISMQHFPFPAKHY